MNTARFSRLLEEHPYAAGVYATISRGMPPQWMFRDLGSDKWHASDRCPLLRTPFEHCSISPSSLPSGQVSNWLDCPSCGAARAFPLGRLLAVLDHGLRADSAPLDWPGLALRRRFVFDPFSGFQVRVSGGGSFWSSLNASLSEWLSATAHAASVAAVSLSSSPLYDALASITLPSTGSWLDGCGSPPRNSAPSRPEPDRAVFLVHEDLPAFCGGSSVQKVVDLFALTGALSPSAVLLKVPSSLTQIVRAAAPEGSVVLSDPTDADTLRWAASLYLSAPSRTLAAAVSASHRLRRGSSPFGEGELECSA